MNVVNLSKHVLTVDELHLLSKGLNFCPTPLEPNPGELRSDLDSFHRSLQLFEDLPSDAPDMYTEEQNNHSIYAFESHKFKPKSSYNPQGPPALEAMIITNEMALNNEDIGPSPH